MRRLPKTGDEFSLRRLFSGEGSIGHLRDNVEASIALMLLMFTAIAWLKS